MKKVILALLLLFPLITFSQLKVGSGLTVVHFNAGWNSANNVKWFGGLSDAKIKRCDIVTDAAAASKYEIVVVPTIIIFNHGKEIKRYQADISFSMKATKSQVQGKIDDVLMESF